MFDSPISQTVFGEPVSRRGDRQIFAGNQKETPFPHMRNPRDPLDPVRVDPQLGMGNVGEPVQGADGIESQKPPPSSFPFTHRSQKITHENPLHAQIEKIISRFKQVEWMWGGDGRIDRRAPSRLPLTVTVSPIPIEFSSGGYASICSYVRTDSWRINPFRQGDGFLIFLPVLQRLSSSCRAVFTMFSTVMPLISRSFSYGA